MMDRSLDFSVIRNASRLFSERRAEQLFRVSPARPNFGFVMLDHRLEQLRSTRRSERHHQLIDATHRTSTFTFEHELVTGVAANQTLLRIDPGEPSRDQCGGAPLFHTRA